MLDLPKTISCLVMMTVCLEFSDVEIELDIYETVMGSDVYNR